MTIDGENRAVVTATLLAAVTFLCFAALRTLPAVFEPLSFQTTDRLFELRGRFPALRPALDPALVVIDIDDASLKRIGTFYLGREEEARLVRNLGRAGVAAQAHDVIYAAPLPGDDALLAATREAGNVYYGMALGLAEGDEAPQAQRMVPERDGWRMGGAGDDSPTLYTAARPLVTFPALAGAARGLGFLDLRVERDGVYRLAPLVARVGDRLVPALALRVVCDYLGVTSDRLEVVPGRRITLHGARGPGGTGPRDVAIPIDGRGRMVVNYAGTWEELRHYPAASIWEASDDRTALEDLGDELRGKIAFLTWTNSGSGDVGPVPGDPQYPLGGVHVNVMNTILTGAFLHRLSPLETFLAVTLPFVALLYVASLRLRTLGFLLAAAGLAVLHVVGATVTFLWGGLIVDLPGPLLVLGVGTIVVAAYHYHLESKARAVLRSTFDAYFPPRVVDRILGSPGARLLGAHKRQISILFSDIQGFTGQTAGMDAGHVRTLLNEYFGRMIEIVFRHDGTLDKFLGDGLMVFFGDPEPQPDHAARAARAAVEMQQAARSIDRAWRARGDMPLRIRIGIHSGEAIVGNMGSERRLSYTALGGSVNLAQRLEANAPVGGILMSEQTHQQIAGAVPTRRLEPIVVKGLDEPLVVYEVALPAHAAEGEGA